MQHFTNKFRMEYKKEIVKKQLIKINMKKYLIIALFTLFSLAAFSQEETKKQSIGKYEFTMELGLLESLRSPNYYTYPLYASSFYPSYQLENSFLAGSITFSNGIRLNNNLYLGFVTGSDFLNVQMIPMLGELKYDFSKNSLTPFLQGQLGGSIALNLNQSEASSYSNSEWRGGFLGTFGFGAKKTFKQTALSFGLIYRYQKIFYSVKYSDVSISSEETEYTMNRIMVKFALTFE